MMIACMCIFECINFDYILLCARNIYSTQARTVNEFSNVLTHSKVTRYTNVAVKPFLTYTQT